MNQNHDMRNDSLPPQVEQWFQQYGSLVYRVIYNHGIEDPDAAQDLVQQVMMRATRRMNGNNPPVTHPKKWLLTIAENVCIDYCKYKQIVYKHEILFANYNTSNEREQLSIDDLESPLEEHPEVIAEKRALLEEMMQYLSELPPLQREAIRLHYLEGWKMKYIAERTGRALSTVHRDISQGLENLRGRFRD